MSRFTVFFVHIFQIEQICDITVYSHHSKLDLASKHTSLMSIVATDQLYCISTVCRWWMAIFSYSLHFRSLQILYCLLCPTIVQCMTRHSLQVLYLTQLQVDMTKTYGPAILYAYNQQIKIYKCLIRISHKHIYQ